MVCTFFVSLIFCTFFVSLMFCTLSVSFMFFLLLSYVIVKVTILLRMFLLTFYCVFLVVVAALLSHIFAFHWKKICLHFLEFHWDEIIRCEEVWHDLKRWPCSLENDKKLKHEKEKKLNTFVNAIYKCDYRIY